MISAVIDFPPSRQKVISSRAVTRGFEDTAVAFFTLLYSQYIDYSVQLWKSPQFPLVIYFFFYNTMHRHQKR